MDKVKIAEQIATFFGAGKSPKAPGTVGSLATLPIAFIIHSTLGGVGLLAFSLLAFVVGCWATKIYLNQPGRGDDPGEIVIDEVAGQSFLLCALFPTWESYLFGFLMFRLFDVVKPWPVSLADKRIKGAVGVMFDDMIAGAYPIIVMMIIIFIADVGYMTDLTNPVFAFLGR